MVRVKGYRIDATSVQGYGKDATMLTELNIILRVVCGKTWSKRTNEWNDQGPKPVIKWWGYTSLEQKIPVHLSSGDEGVRFGRQKENSCGGQFRWW